MRPWISITCRVRMAVQLTAPLGVKATWEAHGLGSVSALLFPKKDNHIELENDGFLNSHFLSTSPMKNKLGSSQEDSIP